ncbi:hypothetical protein EN46_02095 [Citrobacter amalonaticus]
MMSKIFYSATENAFFPDDLKTSYVLAGTWPGDVIEVDYSVFREFAIDTPPLGMVRSPNEEGLPSWIKCPPPSHEHQVEMAKITKSELIDYASKLISPLQDAVDLNIATDIEIDLLAKWRTYRVLVNRIDPENTTDIVWPTKPE